MKTLWDYDDGDMTFSISDNRAIDSGEIHSTSSWLNDDEED